MNPRFVLIALATGATLSAAIFFGAPRTAFSQLPQQQFQLPATMPATGKEWAKGEPGGARRYELIIGKEPMLLDTQTGRIWERTGTEWTDVGPQWSKPAPGRF